MASDQQFCLRWNNHQSTLVSVFDNLLESQTLVDCTLAADGQYLKAHKVVLSACSPYLEAILCQNLDKHPILILKDVKFSELKAMLDYMYRGEVNISQEQLSTFLKAAESLQIKGLTDSGGGGSSDREREPLKRQDLRKPLNQPVPHIPQPRPVVPHPGLMERRSLPHFPPHIADMQPQSPRHAREGSTSPTARKRRRPNRPSSDDSNFVSTPNSLSENQPDTSDSCDVPVKQAASSTPNVPNATTKAPETDSNRTTPQPQNNQQNSEQKQQVTVKKEFSETLLTPKTEFDYGNDNSMEDVTYEDDEEEEVDLSKPGTSFAANSQGFPPWQMGGDGSNDDSNNMYSPDVTAATNQNNSQGLLFYCRYCNRGYKHKTSLNRHARECSANPARQCPAVPARDFPSVTPARGYPVFAPTYEKPLLPPALVKPAATPIHDHSVFTPIREYSFVTPIREKPDVAPIRESRVVASTLENLLVAPIGKSETPTREYSFIPVVASTRDNPAVTPIQEYSPIPVVAPTRENAVATSEPIVCAICDFTTYDKTTLTQHCVEQHF